MLIVPAVYKVPGPLALTQTRVEWSGLGRQCFCAVLAPRKEHPKVQVQFGGQSSS